MGEWVGGGWGERVSGWKRVGGGWRTIENADAVEFAARNPRVRVNCVLTGTPVHREGTLEHVAHAVLFLLENDSVTGVCLPVDGGTRLA